MCDRADARSKEKALLFRSDERAWSVTWESVLLWATLISPSKGWKTAWVKTGVLADPGFAY